MGFDSQIAPKKTSKTFKKAQGRLNTFGFNISLRGIGHVIDISGQGNRKRYSNFATPLKKGKLSELEMVIVIAWTTSLENGVYLSLNNPNIGDPDRLVRSGDQLKVTSLAYFRSLTKKESRI